LEKEYPHYERWNLQIVALPPQEHVVRKVAAMEGRLVD